MRLFAALLPPREVTAQLAAAAEGLRALPGSDRLRWTDRSQWHFTLAFYGEVEEELLPELNERLGRAARRGQPLRLRLSGLGRFGDRTLWAGAEGDRIPMERLAAAVAAAGRRSGIGMEDVHRFNAHLTLARGPRLDGPPGGLAPYVTALEGFLSESWTAEELALVRSRLPVSGVPGEQPTYETVSSWRLGRSD
ncbi:RNA 2',3'-cyclic phosphodiesterase [Streptomyces sp. N2-109]|uniref:RNA 2',3'-cyclic phosphodiesterase n=1 Tax=Streptomyces gossypii TaxID=2883101 RepID=A0ABT2JXU7_9ACTN|nr:RNA 2',3'-cyclic phosphodiesterase [Streptomyces gossypii]MCT2592701.1 RNA 2',3'-cyclic phosphodiesterase [Streptomyces gossypii]